jgi:hypothetical protein
MKYKHALGVITIFLFLTQTLACGNNLQTPVTENTESVSAPTTENTESVPSPTTENTESAPSPTTENTPPAAAIGTVANIRTQVYAGAQNSLELIEGETDLGNDEFVKVADGGKARLNFPGPISLLLYNQSEMDNIKLEFENSSNPRITNRLIRGGFSGYVEPGNQLTIDLAFGVQVNVLGTNFFVLSDDENEFVTVGKFDGTLSVSMPGQDIFYLKDQELIDITTDGKLRYSPIPFTLAQFDDAADSCVSSIQGVNVLRRDSKLPQPGMDTFQEDIELPCKPLSAPPATLDAMACLTPTGLIKVDLVQLREGPDLRFLSVGEYRQNDNFTVTGLYQGWYRVEFSGGKKGWLYTDWISLPSNTDTTKICKILYRDVPPTPGLRCKSSSTNLCP